MSHVHPTSLLNVVLQKATLYTQVRLIQALGLWLFIIFLLKF